MASPIDAIAGDAAAVVPAAAPGLLGGVGERLRRLIQPSPRTFEVLGTDLVAVLVNSTVTGGKEAQLGESVADCVYAFAGTEGGIGGESPIMRLARSIVLWFTGRRKTGVPQP